MFTPYGFIKNLWQIHLKDSHMKFMRKNKAIPCEQNNATWLVKNCKTAFSKLTKISLPVSGKQMSRQASNQPLVFLSQIFTYFPAFYTVILVEHPSCSSHFGQMFNGFLTSTFNFYWSLPLQLSCITVRLSDIFFQVSFSST